MSSIDEKIREKKKELATLEKEIKSLERSIEYPLVKATGYNQIVIFTRPGKGVNINGIGCPLGTESEAWSERDFIPFSGTITYENGIAVKTDQL